MSDMDNKTKPGKPKEVARGTQDELEILGLILVQLPMVRQLVMERLRSAKERVNRREAMQNARTGKAN